MNESSKSYLYGNPRLSAAEWRTNLDNTDTAETLQSMQDIGKNAEWLRAYLQENDTPIEELGLPGREYNELKRSKINTMGDMLALYPDFSVGRGSHIGAQTAKRMRRVVEKFCKRLLDERDGRTASNAKLEEPDSLPFISNLAEEHLGVTEDREPYFSEKTILPTNPRPSKISKQDLARLRKDETPIDELGLSVRSYNSLKRAKINTLGDAAARYPNGFLGIRNLGRKSAEEVCDKIEEWHKCIRNDQPKTPESMSEEPVENAERLMLDLGGMTAFEILSSPEFAERASEFLRSNTTPIEDLGLSARPYNSLRSAKIYTFGELFALYPDKFISLQNLGEKSESELKALVERRMEKLRNGLILYCAGAETSAEVCYSNEDIREKLLAQFVGVGFRGLSFQEIRGDLPESVEDERIKKIIGSLIAEKQLEYVDFRCYRVYPSFFDVLKETPKGVAEMCKELEELYADGRAEGRTEGIGDSIKALMGNVKCTLEQAMDMLGIAVDSRDIYRKMLQNNK